MKWLLLEAVEKLIESPTTREDSYTTFRKLHILEYIRSRLKHLGRVNQVDPDESFKNRVEEQYHKYMEDAISELQSAYEYKINSILAGGVFNQRHGRVIVEDIVKFAIDHYLETQGLHPEYDLEFDGDSITYQSPLTSVDVSIVAEDNDITVEEMAIILGLTEGELTSEDADSVNDYDLILGIQELATESIASWAEDNYTMEEVGYALEEHGLLDDTEAQLVAMYGRLMEWSPGKYEVEDEPDQVFMTKALTKAHHGGLMSDYADITDEQLEELNNLEVLPPGNPQDTYNRMGRKYDDPGAGEYLWLKILYGKEIIG